jgi:hypothetical protein
MVTRTPVDYRAHSYKMSLNNLTGMVRKIQSDYFAYSQLTEIWMGEWSRGRSKLIVQCDSIFPSAKTDPPTQVAVKVIRGGSSGMANDFEGLDMVSIMQAFLLCTHPSLEVATRGENLEPA